MLEGLPPNNASHLMRLTIGEAGARAVADLVVESFEPAEAAATACTVSVRRPAAAMAAAGPRMRRRAGDKTAIGRASLAGSARRSDS